VTRVAGVNGTRDGWAVVIMDADNRWAVRKIRTLSDLFDSNGVFDIVAVDIPIGLLDVYEPGGRACDRAARRQLGKRASSVFPAPVRSVLGATSWEHACILSRAAGPHAKGVTKQTFAILSWIKEVDDLLWRRHELRKVVWEVHPEMCFRALICEPLSHNKKTPRGQAERRQALARVFPQIEMIEQTGRAEGLPTDDILDATVACWSARRLAAREAQSLPDSVLLDATGLRMAIWF
jgi:predicted RNase H-like nuclease